MQATYDLHEDSWSARLCGAHAHAQQGCGVCTRGRSQALMHAAQPLQLVPSQLVPAGGGDALGFGMPKGGKLRFDRCLHSCTVAVSHGPLARSTLK